MAPSNRKPTRQERELARLRELRRLLRGVMERGEILLMGDEKTNTQLIRLAGARGVE